MTCDLRYVAVCDKCSASLVLETLALPEARAAYMAAGYRLVVEGRGRTMRCGACMNLLDAEHRQKMIDLGEGVRETVTLDRPRYRPGSFVCPACKWIPTYDRAAYLFGRAAHPANLRCIPCATADASRRGFDARIAGSLPVEEVIKVEPHPTLFPS